MRIAISLFCQLKQLDAVSVAVELRLGGQAGRGCLAPVRCPFRLDAAEPHRESQLDEMWSWVGNKAHQRGLWQAIERGIGKILAQVFGTRKDEVFLRLKALLMPFGISQDYTDDWGADKHHLDSSKHEVGKRNTPKIENKHLNLRTPIKRLARRTICFSKTVLMHDLVIGLFINRYEFGLSI
jgi:insertion element IS1 protein InsB